MKSLNEKKFKINFNLYIYKTEKYINKILTSAAVLIFCNNCAIKSSLSLIMSISRRFRLLLFSSFFLKSIMSKSDIPASRLNTKDRILICCWEYSTFQIIYFYLLRSLSTPSSESRSSSTTVDCSLFPPFFSATSSAASSLSEPKAPTGFFFLGDLPTRLLVDSIPF